MSVHDLPQGQQGMASDLLAHAISHKKGSQVGTMFGREAAAWAWYEAWVTAQQLLWVEVVVRHRKPSRFSSNVSLKTFLSGPSAIKNSVTPVMITYLTGNKKVPQLSMPALYLKEVPLEILGDDTRTSTEVVTGYYYTNLDADGKAAYFEITEKVLAYCQVPIYKPNTTTLFKANKA